MNEEKDIKDIIKENLEKALLEDISPLANVYFCICDQGKVKGISLFGKTSMHKAIGDLTSVIEAYRADIIRIGVVNTAIAQANKPKIFGAFGGVK